MAEASIEVHGTREVADKLRRVLPARARDALEGAATEAAEIPRDVASQLAPRSEVGHGPGGTHMADNIIVETVEVTRHGVRIAIGPAEDYWYGIFPELGTPTTPAQPFLRPALDHTEDTVTATISRELWTRLMSGVR